MPWRAAGGHGDALEADPHELHPDAGPLEALGGPVAASGTSSRALVTGDVLEAAAAPPRATLALVTDPAPDSSRVLAPVPAPGCPVAGSVASAAAGASPERSPIPAATRGWAAAWEPAPDPTGARGLEE